MSNNFECILATAEAYAVAVSAVVGDAFAAGVDDAPPAGVDPVLPSGSRSTDRIPADKP